MNKFFDLFLKRKRRAHFNTPCCAPDNHSFQKTVFRHYEFDSDCYRDCQPALGVDEPVVEEENENGFHDFLSDSRIIPSLSDLLDSQLANTSVNSDKLNSSFSKTTLLTEQENKPLSGENSKLKKNMFIINISNSKCFHIGLQKNININKSHISLDRARSCGAQLCTENTAGAKVDLSRLLDCDEKLTEDCIFLISLHLGNQWKDFGKTFGLPEIFLEELEIRYENNVTLIVYDMLHKYISQFPNTSFGFIISILSEIHHVALIEKLHRNLSHSK